MKYILMMNTMKAGQSPLPNWSPEELQQHIAFMVQFDEELRKSGELVFAEGLAFPDQATLVRAGKDGLPVTDGVFPESKEFLAGFWVVDVPGAQRAFELAARISAAPGAGGAPLNIPIEVRPLAGPPPQ